MFVLKHRKTDLLRVAFSPDGRWLAACGLRTPIDLWDLAERRHVRRLECGSINRALGFSHDNDWLVALADDAGLVRIGVTDGAASTLPGGEDAHAATFSGDGRQACLCTTDGESTRLRQHLLPGGEVGWESLFANPLSCDAVLAYSGDGRTLAVGLDNGMLHWFDAGTGALRGTLGDDYSPTPAIRAVALSPDGSMAAWCAASRLHVWRLTERERVAEHNLGRTHFHDVAWHPSGAFFATTNGDGMVDTWDGLTGARRGSLDWKAGKLAGLAFDSTGDRAACCSKTGEVIVWDVDR